MSNGFTAADMTTAAANGFRDGLAAQPAAEPAELTVSDEDRAVLQRLQDALPTAGINGWAKGADVLERILRMTLASTPAAPGIDMGITGATLTIDGKTFTVDEVRTALIDASPKGGSADERARFEAWAKAQGRYILEPAVHRTDRYYWSETQGAWEAWQAAMQATSAEAGA